MTNKKSTIVIIQNKKKMILLSLFSKNMAVLLTLLRFLLVKELRTFEGLLISGTKSV